MVGVLSLVAWVVVALASQIGMWFGNDLTLPVDVIPRESVHDKYMTLFYAQSFTRWAPYMFGCMVAALILHKIENSMPAEFVGNDVSMCDLDKEEYFADSSSNLPDARVPSFMGQVKTSQQPAMRKTAYEWTLAIPCTIAGLILMFLPVFLYRFYQNDRANNKAWDSASQLMFAMFGSWSVVAGIIVMGLPAFFGKTSVALMFFGGSFWSPLARMTIGFYIIHMFLIQYNIAQSYAFQYLDNFVIQNYMFADLFFGFLLSLLFCTVIEMPITRFCKKLMWN